MPADLACVLSEVSQCHFSPVWKKNILLCGALVDRVILSVCEHSFSCESYHHYSVDEWCQLSFMLTC